MKKYEVFGDPFSRNVFIQPVDQSDFEQMDQQLRELEHLSESSDWCVVAVPISSWNDDLTPWSAEAVFGKVGFGDGATLTLKSILEEVIPDFEKSRSAIQSAYFLCGYSLAGLFALWAAYQTDFFEAVAAVSPSVWYERWQQYIKEHLIKSSAVYLSLGNQEEHTKNKVMARVGDAIRSQHKLFLDKNVKTVLEWNEGNHFKDSAKRMARGMSWILKNRI